MKQKMSDKAKFIIITASNSTEMSNNQEHSTRGVVLYGNYSKNPRFTVMKILGIAYPKHWILLEVSKYLDENLMQIDLLVLSN